MAVINGHDLRGSFIEPWDAIRWRTLTPAGPPTAERTRVGNAAQITRATNYLPFQRDQKKQWKETVTQEEEAYNVNPRLGNVSRNSTRVCARPTSIFLAFPEWFIRILRANFISVPSASLSPAGKISCEFPGATLSFLDGPQSRRIEASGLIG